MTKQFDPISRTAKCPRCGYDLRGTIETWAERCPLEGRCNECGLEVKWAEVLHPEKFEPMWCVEFVRSRNLLLSSCGKTFLRSFWPIRFWSMLKMSMPIRWHRIASYIAFLFLPLLLSYLVLQATVVGRVRYDIQQSIIAQQSQISQAIANMQSMMKTGRYTSQQQQQVALQLQRYKQAQNSPYKINHSYLAAFFEMVVTPASRKSRGTISGGFAGAWTYPSPYESHMRLFESRLGNLTSVTSNHSFYLTIAWIGLSLWVWVLFPFSFVLLPVSRRRAKVRWGHILRVTIYGCFIPISAISISMFAIAIGYAFEDTFGSMIKIVLLTSRFFVTAFTIIWWAMAIKHYLHILHNWVVVCLLVIMLFFMYLGVLWAVFPNFLLALW